MKKYEDYKDSGVDWLGKIPAHWGVTNLKRVTDFINGAAFKPEDWQSEGIPIVRIQNLNGNEVFNYVKPQQDIKDSCHLFGGELLFSWSGNVGTSFGPFMWEREGLAYLNQHIFKLENYQLDKKYFYWLLRAVTKYIESKTHGIIGMVHVTKPEIGAVPIPNIIPSEQRAIAAYLDHKTAQLDTLLAQKETLLRLLHQKRQALINEAVTQGLDPAAPRKPSGVAWLGDVPAHWEVKKLKYLFDASLGGGTPDTTNDKFWNGDLPWVSPKDMKSPVISATQDYVTELAVKSSSTSLIPENSVMVVVRSGILKHTFPVAINAVPVTLNQDMKAFVPNNLITAEYLAQLLKGFQQHILNQCTKIGATVDSIETEWLYSFPFPVPPREEQKRIVNYLTASNERINEATAAIHTQIQTLKAYRQSLISEVVTGKVDVRTEAQALPGAAPTPSPTRQASQPAPARPAAVGQLGLF